jgi:hypothetical protein
MRGPCACPCWSATIMPDGTQANRVATRTNTRPSHPLHPAPPLVPTGDDPHYPIRLAKVIRVTRAVASPALVTYETAT